MAANDDIAKIEADFQARLERHRRRILPFRIVTGRPRLFIAFAAGAIAGLLVPDSHRIVTRALIGWNVAATIYLALVLQSMFNSDHRRIRFQARMMDDGELFILCFTTLAELAAIGAIVAELAVAKDAQGWSKIGHLGLAGATIVLSWLFIHMIFTLHYAHEYYREQDIARGADPQAASDMDGDGDVDDDDVTLAREATTDPRGGLIFPDTKQPNYLDIAYFSYTIGVASQTADVQISSRPMRAIALAHSILSFFFNTTILALTINLAAGMF
ncbi:MAG: DUF1345 domain-containing protein [Rhodoblastus sp.]